MTRHEPVRIKVLDQAERPVPRAPAGMSTLGRRKWRALWRSGVGKAWDPVADYAVVERLLGWYERLPNVGDDLRLEDRLNAWIQHAETQLGLTTMARARLGLVIGEAKKTARDLNRGIEKDAPREPRAWESQWSEV